MKKDIYIQQQFTARNHRTELERETSQRVAHKLGLNTRLKHVTASSLNDFDVNDAFQ